MIHIDQTVVVEGRYDKSRLANLIDANIIECDGFGIFSDREKMSLLRALAEKNGLIIMTDSDRAGFRIRGYLKGCLGDKNVKHVYIPQILGKERRKSAPSKDGFLGVEGVDDEIILNALRQAGITGSVRTAEPRRAVTVSDLYEDGLCGRGSSRILRKRLAERMGLPSNLSKNGLIEVINILCTYDEYAAMVREIKNGLPKEGRGQ